MKPSERWKQINDLYGGENIRERHKPQAVVTNNQEMTITLPREWAREENREKLLQVIHNFAYLWEREELKEVPNAKSEELLGKTTVSLFLPAEELAQFKDDFKACKQSFRRKGVVLSYLLQRLDINKPILPPRMGLEEGFRRYPPELVEKAKQLATVPLEEHELHSAEFEAFEKSCEEVNLSPHALLQKVKKGKL